MHIDSIRPKVAAEFRRRLRHMGAVPLTFMLLYALVLSWAVSALLVRGKAVDHTHEVIGQANRCFLLAVDMQTGMRGFQLTGAAPFLEPYHAARATADAEWAQLENLVADNPAQQERVKALRRLLTDYVTFAEGVIALRAAGGDVLDRALNEDSKQRFDELRRLFRNFHDEEATLLASRSSVFERLSRAVLAFRFVGALAFALVLSFLIRRSMRRVNAAYETALGELHQSDERHRLALEATGLGTWDWDVKSGALNWDDRCKGIFGFPPEQRITYGLFLDRVCPAERERVDQAVKASLEPKTGGIYDAEFQVCLPDQSVRWVRSKGQVFFERREESRPVRMTGAALDITDVRTRQQQLEIRVAERTRELTEANERLRELDRLKSEFLASMSHELRTPLNSIIGFTEIVLAGLAGPLNDEQKKQLQMSLNSSRHLLSLINDLLDLARIESGRAAPHRERFNLRDVLRTVENTLTPLAARKAVALQIKAPEDVPMFSDRKMVYQILLNLAGNAVKFTEQGRVEILCQDEGTQVRVAVTDTGIGIKPENMKLLFEAFRQVDGSARRKFEGTGLGLHLSRRLADLLGGQIEAESEFGRGSRFTVVLPAHRGESTASS